MQATSYLQGSVQLSTAKGGRRRKHPVWVLRYRLPSGKDSRKVLGRAWTKTSRPPAGFITETQARAIAQSFLDDHAGAVPEHRHTFGLACQAFLRYCERERGLRASTIHDYRRIAERLCERPWRREETWRERPVDTLGEGDVLTLREELLAMGRSAETLNHYRRIVRGALGTHAASAALAWRWAGNRPESEGQLRFYTPDQIAALKRHAHSPLDVAIYTLAAEAGPRLSEIRGLKVRNVDFGVGVVRFEDGFTTRGGHAGNKGRRVRSVPMSQNVRAALWPYCRDRPADAVVFEHELKPGQPICGSGLYRRYRNAAKRAGLPVLRFHDLRHSFGTQAIRAFNIYEVQRMMGHRHITTTERYLHYAPNPDAAAKLSGLWGDGEPEGNVVDFRRVA
ncbi:MAG: tyrosine-type recombinase/integrase [Solirubrobacteraceae bacterium]